MRIREMRKAAERRDDMKGADGGIRASSRELLEDPEILSPYQKGLLRATLMGSVYTAEREARHGRAPGDGACPFCGKHLETRRHLWWECEVWAPLRGEALAALRAVGKSYQNLPQCTQECGLVPNGDRYDWVEKIRRPIQRMQVRIFQERQICWREQMKNVEEVEQEEFVEVEGL